MIFQKLDFDGSPGTYQTYANNTAEKDVNYTKASCQSMAISFFFIKVDYSRLLRAEMMRLLI